MLVAILAQSRPAGRGWPDRGYAAMTDEVISRKLSHTLRHNAENLEIDANGWVLLNGNLGAQSCHSLWLLVQSLFYFEEQRFFVGASWPPKSV